MLTGNPLLEGIILRALPPSRRLRHPDARHLDAVSGKYARQFIIAKIPSLLVLDAAPVGSGSDCSIITDLLWAAHRSVRKHEQTVNCFISLTLFNIALRMETSASAIHNGQPYAPVRHHARPDI